MPTVFLSLGSNLGDRAANLQSALEYLQSTELAITTVSSIYETAPVGETPEPVPHYLNLVACAETSLVPEALLQYTQAVEQAVGRTPTFRWGPRVIDIDILLYDARIMGTENLTVPHPRLFERAFVLAPLAEIAPDLVFPDGSSVQDRLADPAVQGQHLEKRN